MTNDAQDNRAPSILHAYKEALEVAGYPFWIDPDDDAAEVKRLAAAVAELAETVLNVIDRLNDAEIPQGERG